MARQAEEAEAAAERKAAELSRALSSSQANIERLQRQLDKVGLATESTGVGGDGSFKAEAESLKAELGEVLTVVGGGSDAAAAAAGGGEGGAAADAAKALLPLSRMKKGDLVAECESRGLENGGTVAELRARIRIERRQDALVAQLVDRGWSDRRARGALKATSWDVDAAIKKLVG